MKNQNRFTEYKKEIYYSYGHSIDQEKNRRRLVAGCIAILAIVLVVLFIVYLTQSTEKQTVAHKNWAKWKEEHKILRHLQAFHSLKPTTGLTNVLANQSDRLNSNYVWQNLEWKNGWLTTSSDDPKLLIRGRAAVAFTVPKETKSFAYAARVNVGRRPASFAGPVVHTIGSGMPWMTHMWIVDQGDAFGRLMTPGSDIAEVCYVNPWLQSGRTTDESWLVFTYDHANRTQSLYVDNVLAKSYQLNSSVSCPIEEGMAGPVNEVDVFQFNGDKRILKGQVQCIMALDTAIRSENDSKLLENVCKNAERLFPASSEEKYIKIPVNKGQLFNSDYGNVVRVVWPMTKEFGLKSIYPNDLYSYELNDNSDPLVFEQQQLTNCKTQPIISLRNESNSISALMKIDTSTINMYSPQFTIAFYLIAHGPDDQLDGNIIAQATQTWCKRGQFPYSTIYVEEDGQLNIITFGIASIFTDNQIGISHVKTPIEWSKSYFIVYTVDPSTLFHRLFVNGLQVTPKEPLQWIWNEDEYEETVMTRLAIGTFQFDQLTGAADCSSTPTFDGIAYSFRGSVGCLTSLRVTVRTDEQVEQLQQLCDNLLCQQ